MAVSGNRGIGHRLALRLVPFLYAVLSRVLFASCTIVRAGSGLQQIEERLASGQPVIVCFWHYGAFLFPYLSRGSRWVAMVSASEDGEYIARILARLGHLTVRGSSNRGGVAALKGLIGRMREGRNAVIVADGSQGPARRAQPGAILLAARSGYPIIPVAWAANRYWTFRSWDRTILPKPGAHLRVEVGEPLTVPSGCRGDALKIYCQELEARLNTAYSQAWRQMGRAGHWPVD